MGYPETPDQNVIADIVAWEEELPLAVQTGLSENYDFFAAINDVERREIRTIIGDVTRHCTQLGVTNDEYVFHRGWYEDMTLEVGMGPQAKIHEYDRRSLLRIVINFWSNGETGPTQSRSISAEDFSIDWSRQLFGVHMGNAIIDGSNNPLPRDCPPIIFRPHGKRMFYQGRDYTTPDVVGVNTKTTHEDLSYLKYKATILRSIVLGLSAATEEERYKL